MSWSHALQLGLGVLIVLGAIYLRPRRERPHRPYTYYSPFNEFVGRR